jgi:hypothetical protein
MQSDPRWGPFLARLGMAPAQLDAIEFDVRPGSLAASHIAQSTH